MGIGLAGRPIRCHTGGIATGAQGAEASRIIP